MLTRIVAQSAQRCAAWQAGCTPYNGAGRFACEDCFRCSAPWCVAHGVRGLFDWHIHYENYPQQNIYG